MKVLKFGDMINGWFIGNFEPAVLKTDQFEVAYHKHKKGEQHDIHYHKKATEYNLLIRGKMIMNDKEFSEGDIVIMEPYDVAEAVFLTDVEIVVVKVPSVKNDKYVIKLK